ncbi:MAG: hypothetical protein IPJ65_24690 [Archangiaceae bacterium]|nr:hypothetical protein [Archangiaceae bacterium]
MLTLLVTVALHATPRPVVLENHGFEGPTVRADELAYLEAFFANQLRAQGVKVTAKGEAARPPGSDGVLEGTLTRAGRDSLSLDLKVLGGTSETLAARSVTAQNDSEAYELLRRAAQEIALELFHQLERTPVSQVPLPLPPAPEQPSSAVPGLVVAGLGVLAAAGGGVMVFIARDQLSKVRNGAPDTYFHAKNDAEVARSLSLAGVVLAGVGAAAVVGGALYALVVNRWNARLEVVVVPGGAMVGFTGSLP